MKKNTVVYIVSNINKAVAFEWIIEDFISQGLSIHFILLNDQTDTALAKFLSKSGISFDQIKLGGKWNFPLVWLKLVLVLNRLKPKVVHTHLFEASLLGLSAAKIVGIKKRVYTRHHSTYHHEYYNKAVKYDKLVNFFSTDIVAISNNVKQLLIQKEGVSEKKVKLIEHGFKLEKFSSIAQENLEAIQNKHKIPKNHFVIGSISRYIKWKGVEHVIRAFKRINQEYPNTHLVLANASGAYKEVVQAELKNLPHGTYTEIVFEQDLFSLYHLLDVFVHVPINSRIEAFGQTYVEALAAGIPSVFTLSGVANDFIVHGKNAVVVNYENDVEITSAIKELMNNKERRNQMIEQGRKDVGLYNFERMISSLYELYGIKLNEK